MGKGGSGDETTALIVYRTSLLLWVGRMGTRLGWGGWALYRVICVFFHVVSRSLRLRHLGTIIYPVSYFDFMRQSIARHVLGLAEGNEANLELGWLQLALPIAYPYDLEPSLRPVSL